MVEQNPRSLVSVRLDDSIKERIDAWRRRAETRVQGLDLTLSESVRILLRQALDADEGGEG